MLQKQRNRCLLSVKGGGSNLENVDKQSCSTVDITWLPYPAGLSHLPPPTRPKASCSVCTAGENRGKPISPCLEWKMRWRAFIYIFPCFMCYPVVQQEKSFHGVWKHLLPRLQHEYFEISRPIFLKSAVRMSAADWNCLADSPCTLTCSASTTGIIFKHCNVSWEWGIRDISYMS